MPDVPGVMPVEAGSEDPGVAGAVLVGSCWPLTELETAVAMSVAAAMGMFGRPMDGTLGRTGDLAAWCCSLD
ncbi:hypothetical protein [Mycobacteroides chelonae]|uniref:hypothetical protein n=1 Tax=Mycobacteroides chelonae TaxID=1774 RepID=UPI001E440E76|nr:hypothetical protein [Mycobacteroides chelonae]